MACMGVCGLGCATSTKQPLPYTLSAQQAALLRPTEQPHPFLALESTVPTPIPQDWFFPKTPRGPLSCTWTRLGPEPQPPRPVLVSFLALNEPSSQGKFGVRMTWTTEGIAQPFFSMPLAYIPTGQLQGTRTLPTPSPANGERYEEKTGDREEYVVFGSLGKRLVAEFHRWVAPESSSPLQKLPSAWLIPPGDPYKDFWHTTGTLVCDEEPAKILPGGNPK